MGKRGIFITFEGGEASGKTTQSKMLQEHLKRENIPCIWTREIGSTPVSEEIRTLVLNYKMFSQTELLLAMAARYEHVTQVIAPALNKGTIVICDRFVDSTAAYQTLDQEITIDQVYEWHQKVFGVFFPITTFFLNVSSELCIQRLKMRQQKRNKFEELDSRLHSSIHANFKLIAQKFPQRILTIDGSKSIPTIHQQILLNMHF